MARYMLNQCPASRTTLHTAYCEPCVGCSRARHHATKAGHARPIYAWLYQPPVGLLFLRSRLFLAVLFLRSAGPASSLQQAERVQLRADQDWLCARAVRAQRSSGGRVWRDRVPCVKRCLHDSLNRQKKQLLTCSGEVELTLHRLDQHCFDYSKYQRNLGDKGMI